MPHRAKSDRVTVKKTALPVGRPSVLRHANALNVLRLLREANSCSRADLVRASGLSAPTITNVVKDLLAANLIEPLGEGESNGGRPPDMIRFKAERGCVLAVEITATHISFLLADLNGTQLTTQAAPLAGKKTTPDAICAYISQEARHLLRTQKMTREQLLAVVVGVPAITNVAEGVVLSVSTLENWRSVPLRAMLSKVFDCLVIIENDTNLAAQGERYRGAAQAQENFVLISISSGIGAGIVLNGRIHHGSQWSAGEIAYLRIPNVSRRYPTIHEFAELETVLGEAGILNSWYEINGQPEASETKDQRKVKVGEVLDLAQAGDVRAQSIIKKRATMVADMIMNMSLILNPSLILLGGRVGGHPVLINSVRKQLQESEFGVTEIGAGALGENATLWGAICVALEVIPSVLLPQPTI
jgi:glucokinase